MRAAIVDNGVIVNVIEINDLSVVPDAIPCGDFNIGDEWDGTEFHRKIDPLPVIPTVVTPFQAKAALLTQGLLDDVEALIADPSTDPLVKLAWQTALEFRRTSPSVLGMAQALGWTDEQLDSLFTLAAGIEA